MTDAPPTWVTEQDKIYSSPPLQPWTDERTWQFALATKAIHDYTKATGRLVDYVAAAIAAALSRPQRITDAEVEAAAMAVSRASLSHPDLIAWDEHPHEWRERCRSDARAALEAFVAYRQEHP